jgi:hypothetical protein
VLRFAGFTEEQVAHLLKMVGANLFRPDHELHARSHGTAL